MNLDTTRPLRPYQARQAAKGFTLIEVLIALVVVSVGLLGMAKTQALALSSTQLSAGRSLIALQAASLASAMHGNPAYWRAGLAPSNFSTTGATVSDSTGILNATVGDCTTLCNPAQLAAHDVQIWASNMNQQFPSYSATVVCSTIVGAPISCTLNIAWSEKTVAYNTTTSVGASAQLSTQSYILYIEP